MIAIGEFWPFNSDNTEQAGKAAKNVVAGAASGARKVLGQGLSADGSQGAVGKVLSSIAKRNQMLAAAAANN